LQEEAKSLGLALEPGLLPQTMALATADAEGSAFSTSRALAVAGLDRAGSADRAAADAPVPGSRFRMQAAGRDQPAVSRGAGYKMATPAISREGYYQMAALEALYLDMLETLQALRLDAASYLVDGRGQPGIPAERANFSAASLIQVPLQDVAAQASRFGDLRLRLPRLVDLADPQSLPVCAPDAPVRYYWIAAVDAKTALRDGSLVYHRFRPGTSFANPARNTIDNWKAVHDPTGLLYVRVSDLDRSGKLRQDRKIEPLILHGRAGECLSVMLTNVMTPSDMDHFSNLPNITPGFNINQLRTTERVGIHAQSLRKHVATNDGINVGTNPVQTVLPGQSRRYTWYAGVVDWTNRRSPKFQPVEFGALNLMPADPIKQAGKGLFGALVVEGADSYWAFDTTPPEPFSGSEVPLLTRASAVVFSDNAAPYRDFVLIGQNDANFRLSGSRVRLPGRILPTQGSGTIINPQLLGLPAAARRPMRLPPFLSSQIDEPVRRVAQCAGADNDAIKTICEVGDEETDAVDAGHNAFNYRSEAGWMRRQHSAAMPLSVTALQRQHDMLSDSFNGINSPNQTPRFCARPGDPVRMRVLFPNGHGRNHVIEVAGHNWDDQPFVNNSTELGTDPMSNQLGTRDVVGPGSHWNLLLSHGAGGSDKVQGDYAIRDLYSWGFDGGLWAVMRVGEQCQ
jgi:hypothetical protein